MVSKRRESWSDHLQLISAVKIGGEVTALAIMPQRGENELARYFAAGDHTGRVYIFRPDGDLALECDSATNSSVTALGVMLMRRNESIVVSGHANGDVIFHQISESVHQEDAVVNDDLHVLSVEIVARQSMVRVSPLPGVQARARNGGAGTIKRSRGSGVRGARTGADTSADASRAGESADEAGGGSSGESDEAMSPEGNLVATEAGNTGVRITAVEGYRIQQQRFIAVADSAGGVAVYKDNGHVLHAVFRATSPVVAFKQSTHSVAWLTEDGVGAADPNTRELRTVGCQQLNGTSVVHARFDMSVSSKFFAVSQDGELLTGFVNVDNAKLGCAIRNRRSLGLNPGSTVATIKGYVFVAGDYDVGVLNTTASGRKPPKEVLTAPLQHLAAMFGHHLREDTHGPALVVSNRGRLVVVAFPDGLLASYESDLPVWKPEPMNTKLWSQPLFVVAVVLIAVWQFNRQKSSHAGGGGPRGGGFDPAMLASFAKDGGMAGGGMKGGGSMGGMGRYGEKAMKRPGYNDFDPATFRAEMKSAGKWDK
jgi:hypothetical protein